MPSTPIVEGYHDDRLAVDAGPHFPPGYEGVTSGRYNYVSSTGPVHIADRSRPVESVRWRVTPGADQTLFAGTKAAWSIGQVRAERIPYASDDGAIASAALHVRVDRGPHWGEIPSRGRTVHDLVLHAWIEPGTIQLAGPWGAYRAPSTGYQAECVEALTPAAYDDETVTRVFNGQLAGGRGYCVIVVQVQYRAEPGQVDLRIGGHANPRGSTDLQPKTRD